jgi:uncharacterized protein YjdB
MQAKLAQFVDTAHDAEFVAAPTDANGNPTPDTLTWHTSDPTVATVEPSADGLSCRAVSVGPGVVTIQVTDGTRSETETITITAVAPPTVAALNVTVTVVPKQ